MSLFALNCCSQLFALNCLNYCSPASTVFALNHHAVKGTGGTSVVAITGLSGAGLWPDSADVNSNHQVNAAGS